MTTDTEIESEIQAKGLNAPRLTPDLIEAQIVSEVSGQASMLFKDVPHAPAPDK